jgi:hypothetical protein
MIKLTGNNLAVTGLFLASAVLPSIAVAGDSSRVYYLRACPIASGVTSVAVAVATCAQLDTSRDFVVQVREVSLGTLDVINEVEISLRDDWVDCMGPTPLRPYSITVRVPLDEPFAIANKGLQPRLDSTASDFYRAMRCTGVL